MNKLNRFDNVPNDVIIYMALNYDLATVTAFCQTSSKFNQLVCQNNNFWLGKLEKDFGLTRDDMENHRDNEYLTNPTPRRYYLYIDQTIKNIPDMDLLYGRAVGLGDLSLVKIATSRGADISSDISAAYLNPNTGYLESSLLKAYRDEYYDITDYLLEQGVINSNITARRVISGILRIASSYDDNEDINYIREKKIRLLIELYEKVIPRTIKHIGNSGKDNKKFWNTVADKLQELQDNHLIDINDIYQKWYQKYKNLAR